ncbi:MAG: acyl-CoA reductase [Polyangiaceae bacterium]
MVEAREQRALAIRRITDATGRVADDKTIVNSLIGSTGLSREGVELAFAECLETYPSDEEILTMVDRASTAKRVHVILSANVFTAPLRAIAWARATAPKVSVSISSREPVFATALLNSIANPTIFKADREVLERLEPDDEVHVYGRAHTIEAVRARAPAGVIVRAHGPGFGVACIADSDDLEAAATALASDVVVFDQRGCLSPRVAFVAGDAARATAFAKALASALEISATHVPRGALAPDEAAEAARYVETMRFAGEAFVGASSVVGTSAGLVLPPTGRHVHVVAFARRAEIVSTLRDALPFVTTAGTSDREIASSFPVAVRVAALGQMQNPPFDGPVDLR